MRLFLFLFLLFAPSLVTAQRNPIPPIVGRLPFMPRPAIPGTTLFLCEADQSVQNTNGAEVVTVNDASLAGCNFVNSPYTSPDRFQYLASGPGGAAWLHGASSYATLRGLVGSVGLTTPHTSFTAYVVFRTDWTGDCDILNKTGFGGGSSTGLALGFAYLNGTMFNEYQGSAFANLPWPRRTDSQPIWNDGLPHIMRYVYDAGTAGGTARIYFDGILWGEQTGVTALLSHPWDTTNTFNVGPIADSGGMGTYFDMGLWNVDAEVQSEIVATSFTDWWATKYGVTLPTPCTTYTAPAPSPASGPVGAASSPIPVTLNGVIGVPVIVTPMSSGGTFSPTSLTFDPNGESVPAAQTFTFTPTLPGAQTIMFDNDGGGGFLTISDPAPFTYTGTVTYSQDTASPAVVGVSQTATYTLAAALGEDIIITPADSLGGSFSPSTVTIAMGGTVGTSSWTPAAAGTADLTATNNLGAGVTDPSTLPVAVWTPLTDPVITAVALEGGISVAFTEVTPSTGGETPYTRTVAWFIPPSAMSPTGTQVLTLGQTTYTIPGLSPGTALKVQEIVQSTDGQTVGSNAVTLTTLAAPIAPPWGNLIARPINGETAWYRKVGNTLPAKTVEIGYMVGNDFVNVDAQAYPCTAVCDVYNSANSLVGGGACAFLNDLYCMISYLPQSADGDVTTAGVYGNDFVLTLTATGQQFTCSGNGLIPETVSPN
jgi:hypothetical protein